jgi:hypothetical protein
MLRLHDDKLLAGSQRVAAQASRLMTRSINP